VKDILCFISVWFFFVENNIGLQQHEKTTVKRNHKELSTFSSL